MKTFKQLQEVLKKSDDLSTWISDFVHSDNPKFAGKSKKERIDMAKGAYYGAQKEDVMKEETVWNKAAKEVKTIKDKMMQSQLNDIAKTLDQIGRAPNSLANIMGNNLIDKLNRQLQRLDTDVRDGVIQKFQKVGLMNEETVTYTHKDTGAKMTSKNLTDVGAKSLATQLKSQQHKNVEIHEGENKQMKGSDPCWKGYQMVGTKKKGGKEVPNCVPEESEIPLSDKEKNKMVSSKDKGTLGKIHSLMQKQKAKRPADWAQALAAEEVNEAKEHVYHFYNGARDEYGKKHVDAANKMGIKAKTSDSGKDIFLKHHDHKHVSNFVKKHLKGEHENNPHDMPDHKVHSSHFKEDVEQIDELSKDTLKSYVKGASQDLPRLGNTLGRLQTHGKLPNVEKNVSKTITNRYRGINKAADKLTKEDVEQIDELSKDTLKSYADKAHQDAKDKAIQSYSAKSAKKADELKDKANKRTEFVKKADLKAASMKESRAHKIIATKLANMDTAKHFKIPTPAERQAMEKEKEKKSYKQFKEELQQVDETLTAKLVKQGIGIARDKRYAGGNMTGATKAMDKLHPKLQDHPRVKDELKKQNEELETEGVLSKQAHADMKNMTKDEFATKYGKTKSAYRQTAQTKVEEVELEEGLGNVKNNTQTIHKPTTDSMRVHSYKPPKKLATSPLKDRPATTAAKSVSTGVTSTVATKGKPVTQDSKGRPITQKMEKKPVTKKEVNLGQKEEVEKDENPHKGKHQQIKFLQKEEIDEFDMENFKMKSYKEFMEQLNEYTPDKSGRTIIKGRAYGGASQHDDEHEAEFGKDHEDKEKYKEKLFGKTAKKEKPAETPVKKGRGRPTGSKPGTYSRR